MSDFNFDIFTNQIPHFNCTMDHNDMILQIFRHFIDYICRCCYDLQSFFRNKNSRAPDDEKILNLSLSLSAHLHLLKSLSISLCVRYPFQCIFFNWFRRSLVTSFINYNYVFFSTSLVFKHRTRINLCRLRSAKHEQECRSTKYI